MRYRDERAWESLDKREKFQKKRKKEREHKSKNQDLGGFVISPERAESMLAGDNLLFQGRVVEVHKRYAFIAAEPSAMQIESGALYLGSMAQRHSQERRRERNFIAVGDRVICTTTKAQSGDVYKTCSILYRWERDNAIARLDPIAPQRQHILACNLSLLVVVASYLSPKLKWGLIDRYLVLAEEQKVPALIVLNKRDLLEEFSPELKAKHLEYAQLYRDLGYKVISFQAKDASDAEISELRDCLVGQICLLTGHSGVGKSSLANLFSPELEQDVERDAILTKGRHTTSYASLLRLRDLDAAYLVDTPGIRSFMLQSRSSLELTWAFREFRPFLNKCQYRECQHISEPECAVLDAVQRGEISSWRYRSYLAILTGASSREGRLRDITPD